MLLRVAYTQSNAKADLRNPEDSDTSDKDVNSIDTFCPSCQVDDNVHIVDTFHIDDKFDYEEVDKQCWYKRQLLHSRN